MRAAELFVEGWSCNGWTTTGRRRADLPASNPTDTRVDASRQRTITVCKTFEPHRSGRCCELYAFLASVDSSDRLYGMWRVLGLTGLRRGEAAGLQWQDVDLQGDEQDPGRIRVARQYKPDGKGGFIFGPPKSEQGRRTVNLDPTTVEVLRDHRQRQLEERSQLGLSGRPELVFTSLDGGPIRPDSGISKKFDRLVGETDLPRIRLHDLRHTHCAHLIASGTDLKAISTRLGHASASFTLDRYGHLLPGRQAEAAARVAAMVDDFGQTPPVLIRPQEL